MALVKHDAAVMIRDAEAKDKMIPEALKIIQDASKMTALSKNILNLAEQNSAGRIAEEVKKLLVKF